MPRTPRAPVTVTSDGPEPVLYAALPASVPQALRIARQYADQAAGGETLLVSRGHKVLHRLEQEISQELKPGLDQELEPNPPGKELAEPAA